MVIPGIVSSLSLSKKARLWGWFGSQTTDSGQEAFLQKSTISHLERPYLRTVRTSLLTQVSSISGPLTPHKPWFWHLTRERGVDMVSAFSALKVGWGF